jgi:hypothetical protein
LDICKAFRTLNVDEALEALEVVGVVGVVEGGQVVDVVDVVEVVQVGFDVPSFEATGRIRPGATALARRPKPGWFDLPESLGRIWR